MEAGQLWRQYLVAGIANLGIFSAGYSMGWTSPVNVILRDQATSPLPEVISTDEESWIGSLLPVGAIFGPFFAGFLVSRVGRKWSLLLSSVPLFVGWILIAAATNVAFLYAGRVFWGVAVGMLFTVSPMYCAEIATVRPQYMAVKSAAEKVYPRRYRGLTRAATNGINGTNFTYESSSSSSSATPSLEDDVRGALGSFLMVFISLGFLLVYSIGPYLSYSAIAYVGVAIVAIFDIALFFMPESPIYHLTKNDHEAAASCIMQLRGRTRAGVQAELDTMARDAAASTKKPASIFDIFKGANFKAFYISTALICFLQLCGINAVLFYMTNIFEAAGSELDPAIATIIIGAVQVGAAFVCPFVVDRLGRRPLLLFSSCGTALALALLGMYFFLDDRGHDAVDSMAFLPVTSLVAFMVAYSVGLGALPLAILGELCPIEVKGIVTPIVTAICWILSFLITRFFGPISEALGMYAAFWIFGASCACAFIFTYFRVPETKNKSFSEVQEMLVKW